MDGFNVAVPLWDLSSSYTQVSDDDFLALLQKDFPVDHNRSANSENNNINNTNPALPSSALSFDGLQTMDGMSGFGESPIDADGNLNPNFSGNNIGINMGPNSGAGMGVVGANGYVVPTVPGHSTPPLTDDSSSSPSSNQDHNEHNDNDLPASASGRDSRRVSIVAPGDMDAHSSPSANDRLKRKASGADLQEGGRKSDPKHKSTNGGPVRQKPQKDEVRLQRRKEQNRAAQRAFRERKERHVLELEERVAELEAAQAAKDSENENLRDLLTRLREENQALKDGKNKTTGTTTGGSGLSGQEKNSAFTFSMPSASSSSTVAQAQSQTKQRKLSQSQPQPSKTAVSNNNNNTATTSNTASNTASNSMPPPPPLMHHSSSSSSNSSLWQQPPTQVATPQLVENSPPVSGAPGMDMDMSLVMAMNSNRGGMDSMNSSMNDIMAGTGSGMGMHNGNQNQSQSQSQNSTQGQGSSSNQNQGQDTNSNMSFGMGAGSNGSNGTNGFGASSTGSNGFGTMGGGMGAWGGALSDIDWNALTTFDASNLSILDADINMMDFSSEGMGFGDAAASSSSSGNGNGNNGDASNGSNASGQDGLGGGAPFKTIASNPMFMSFAEPFNAWDMLGTMNPALGANINPNLNGSNNNNNGSNNGNNSGNDTNAPSRQSSFNSIMNWDGNVSGMNLPLNSFGSWSGYGSGMQGMQGQNGMGSGNGMQGMQNGNGNGNGNGMGGNGGQQQQQQQQQNGQMNLQSWPGSPQNGQQQQHQQQQQQGQHQQRSQHSQNSLDDLFGLGGGSAPMDLVSSPSGSMSLGGNGNVQSPSAQSILSSLSSLSSLSESPGVITPSSPPIGTPMNSMSGMTSPNPNGSKANSGMSLQPGQIVGMDGQIHATGTCPRTKADFASLIASEMKSPFANTNNSPFTKSPAGGDKPQNPFLVNNSPFTANASNIGASGSSPASSMSSPGNNSAKAPSPSSGVSPREGAGAITVSLNQTGPMGPQISCTGSVFPKTEKSIENIEVLAAWRQITSNPQFKNVDINELCAEFTNKAKCDGTKVVLDPAGVHQILNRFGTQ